jgi:hypothetical protein
MGIVYFPLWDVHIPRESVVMPKLTPQISTDLDADTQLRTLVAMLIKQSGKSREEIAKKMSLLAKRPISQQAVNGWTAKAERGQEASRRSRFPAFLVPIFCEVVGNDALQRWLVGARLRELIEFAEATRRVLNS